MEWWTLIIIQNFVFSLNWIKYFSLTTLLRTNTTISHIFNLCALFFPNIYFSTNSHLKLRAFAPTSDTQPWFSSGFSIFLFCFNVFATVFPHCKKQFSRHEFWKKNYTNNACVFIRGSIHIEVSGFFRAKWDRAKTDINNMADKCEHVLGYAVIELFGQKFSHWIFGRN